MKTFSGYFLDGKCIQDHPVITAFGLCNVTKMKLF